MFPRLFRSVFPKFRLQCSFFATRSTEFEQYEKSENPWLTRVFNTTMWKKTIQEIRVAKPATNDLELTKLSTPELPVVARFLVEEPLNSEQFVQIPTEEINSASVYPLSIVSAINKCSENTVTKDLEKNEPSFSDSGGVDEPEEWRAMYGTPDPDVPSSQFPCGGCGAVLHCQNEALPGYMPSEVFVGLTKVELKNSLCQRCIFLADHQVALNVNISPKDYEKVLSDIKDKPALVLLVVDILDFPCSIWSGILDVIGRGKPIFVIGNKVDVLPQDSKGYLNRVESSLRQNLKDMGIDTGNNVKHVCLVSAKTGYGIEDLITELQNFYKSKGDVYLIGCTNVGKSSLFNALLQSDYCKVQATDLVTRATTSLWPGTTLNLLKFPILKPTPWRLYVRNQRIKSWRRIEKDAMLMRQANLAKTKDPQYATLIGHVGQTFKNLAKEESLDMFSTPHGTLPKSARSMRAFNAEDYEFAHGKWCFDTPGSVHSAQIINLLTLEELSCVIPIGLISPRSFTLFPKSTLFLAGLGRIDYCEGDSKVILTVFSSDKLPVTVLPTSDADEFYQEFLGTDVLKVPFGGPQRLKDFPPLESAECVTITNGLGLRKSSIDIVLSSAGWVAITLRPGETATFKPYTPEARGCFVRNPPILPYAVGLRGKRIKKTPFYHASKIYQPGLEFVKVPMPETEEQNEEFG